MAKCKICGARMDDGAAKCPMCGAAAGVTAESLQPKPLAQDQPRQSPPQQQTVPSYGGTAGWSSQPVQQTVTVQIPPPPVMAQPQASGDATEDELIDAYISGNAGGIPARTHALEHYRGALCSPISWNWATAFTSCLNLFYRRCWGWALLSWLISWLCALVLGSNILLAQVVYFIIMGLAGDRIIYARYRRTVQQALSLYPGTKSNQLSYVAEHGGTRTGLVITIIVITVILLLVVFFVYGAAIMAMIYDWGAL